MNDDDSYDDDDEDDDDDNDDDDDKDDDDKDDDDYQYTLYMLHTVCFIKPYRNPDYKCPALQGFVKWALNYGKV